MICWIRAFAVLTSGQLKLIVAAIMFCLIYWGSMGSCSGVGSCGAYVHCF